MIAVAVIIGVALIATLGYLAWLAEKKRREEMVALAQELGLRFDPGIDHDHDDEYAQFEIFRRGHSRVARNTLHGSIQLFDQDCSLDAGDFRYKVTSGSGKNRRTTTHRFSYLIVHPPWDTPPLLIRPEGIFDKVAGAFGFDDIDFESVEFSKRFYVKSTDKRFAYDVLHARTAYRDDNDAAGAKRHMMRIWLSHPRGRPLPEVFATTREFVHSYRRRQRQQNA